MGGARGEDQVYVCTLVKEGDVDTAVEKEMSQRAIRGHGHHVQQRLDKMAE